MLNCSSASVRAQRCLQIHSATFLQLRGASKLSAIKRGIREESPRLESFSRRPRQTPQSFRDDRPETSVARPRSASARFSPRQERFDRRSEADGSPRDGRHARGYESGPRSERRNDGQRTSEPPQERRNGRERGDGFQGGRDKRYEDDRSSRGAPSRRNEEHDTMSRPPRRFESDWSPRGAAVRRRDEGSSVNRSFEKYDDRRSSRPAARTGPAETPDPDQGYEDGSSSRNTPSRNRNQIFSRDNDQDRLFQSSWSNGRKSESTEDEKRPQRGSAAMEYISVPYTTAASEFLYGLNVVFAALKSKKRKLYTLYLHDRASDNATKGRDLERLAKSVGVTVKRIRNDFLPTMDKMADGRPHNGVILEASALPVPPVARLERIDATRNEIPLSLSPQSAEERAFHGITQIISYERSAWRQPLVLLLDGITDPGNIGNIVRTAYFYGVDAVAICTNTCAPVSLATLVKAASGATEAVPLLAVQKPADFVSQSSANGWRICAAVAPQPRDRDYHPKKASWTQSQTQLHTHRMTSPLARGPAILMMGAEGEGLRENLRSKARYNIAIEGARRERADDLGVDSLNVGAATAVLIEAFMRRPQANYVDRSAQDTSASTGEVAAGNGEGRKEEEREAKESTETARNQATGTPSSHEEVGTPEPSLLQMSREREALKDEEIASLLELETKFKKMAQEMAALETAEPTAPTK